MKIKEKVTSVVAIVTLFVIVSGFQIDSNRVEATILGTESVEEIAYAGPCSDNGCIGGKDLCMVVEILWGAFKRTCYTTISDQPGELAQLQ